MTARSELPGSYVQSAGSAIIGDFSAVTFNNATLSNDATVVKNSVASRKIVPTGASSAAAITLAQPFNFGTGAVLGLWVYLQGTDPNLNMTSAGNPYLNIQLINTGGASYNTCKEFSFAGYHLKWGQWNFLPMHTGDTGKWQADPANTGWKDYSPAGNFANDISKVFIVFGNMTGASIWVDSLVLNPRSRPKVLLGFDAVSTNLNSVALPVMQAAGIKGFVTYNGVGGGAPATNVSLLPAWRNIGWEVVNHGATHTNVGSMTTDQAIINEVETNWNLMVQNNLINSGQVKAWIGPENGSSPRSTRVIKQLGYKLARNYLNMVSVLTPQGVDEPLNMGCYGLGNPISRQTLFDKIEAAIAYGGATWLFAHEVNAASGNTGPTGDNNTIYVDDLTAVVNKLVYYRDKGLLDIVSPTEFYDGLTKPRLLK